MTDLGKPTLNLNAYNETVVPSMSFAEVELVDGTYRPTGKSVVVSKEEWKGHPGYPVSDSIVGFFEELLGTHPVVKELMDKYGIVFHLEETDANPTV